MDGVSIYLHLDFEIWILQHVYHHKCKRIWLGKIIDNGEAKLLYKYRQGSPRVWFIETIPIKGDPRLIQYHLPNLRGSAQPGRPAQLQPTARGWPNTYTLTVSNPHYHYQNKNSNTLVFLPKHPSIYI